MRTSPLKNPPECIIRGIVVGVAKGIPTPQIQKQVAKIRKRYAMNLAEIPSQAAAHGPKKARLSSNYENSYIRIETDASGYAIGGILSQFNEGIGHWHTR